LRRPNRPASCKGRRRASGIEKALRTRELRFVRSEREKGREGNPEREKLFGAVNEVREPERSKEPKRATAPT